MLISCSALLQFFLKLLVKFIWFNSLYLNLSKRFLPQLIGVLVVLKLDRGMMS